MVAEGVVDEIGFGFGAAEDVGLTAAEPQQVVACGRGDTPEHRVEVRVAGVRDALRS